MKNRIVRQWDLLLKGRGAKLAVFICIFSMLISGFPVFADSTQYTYNLNDATLCLKLAVGIINMPEDETQKDEYMNKFDADRNGQVNLYDAVTVLKYAVGILTPENNGNNKPDNPQDNENSERFEPLEDIGRGELLTPPAVATDDIDLTKLKEDGVTIFPYELYKYTYYNGYYGFFYEDNILDDLHELYDLKVQAGDVNVDSFDKYLEEISDFNCIAKNDSEGAIAHRNFRGDGRYHYFEIRYHAGEPIEEYETGYYAQAEDCLPHLLTVSGDALENGTISGMSVELTGNLEFTVSNMAHFSEYRIINDEDDLNYLCDESHKFSDDVYYAASSSAVMPVGEWESVSGEDKKNISFCYLKPVILPTLEEQGYSGEIPEDNPYDKYFSGFNKEFYNLMCKYSPGIHFEGTKGTAKFNKDNNTVTITSPGWDNMTVPINTLGNYNGMFGYFCIVTGEYNPEKESWVYNPDDAKKADEEFKNIIGKYAVDFPFWQYRGTFSEEPDPEFAIDGYENYDLCFSYAYMPDKSWLGPYYPDDAGYAVVTNWFFCNAEADYFVNNYKKFWYFNVMKDCILSVDGVEKEKAYMYGDKNVETGCTYAHDKISKASENADSLLFPNR